MRLLSLAILTLALASTACSHDSKKGDVKPEAKNTPGATADAGKSPEPKTITPDPNASKVECSVKGDARILEVRTKGSGCELGYTKAGKEGIVASAAHGNDYCQKAFEKLRDKLKGSGYDCK